MLYGSLMLPRAVMEKKNMDFVINSVQFYIKYSNISLPGKYLVLLRQVFGNIVQSNVNFCVAVCRLESFDILQLKLYKHKVKGGGCLLSLAYSSFRNP